MAQIEELQNQFLQALSDLELPENPKDLYDPIKYTLSNGGKRMRPLLVLMGCKIFDENISNALNPAIGIELFHNFTLIHDDIMDDAPLRRGQPAVHNKWTSNIAILSGDAMMVKTYQSLIKTNPTVLSSILTEFNKTAVEVCEGQQFDMDFELRDDVTIDEYLNMIKLKTAVLLAASLKIGALIGGANEENAKRIHDFGLNAGMAFQLQDDILDVYGESKKVGKQKGGDIISNKKTFLLLKAMELASGNTSSMLNKWLASTGTTDKVEAVIAIYEELGVKILAEDKMWGYYHKAMSNLEKVEGNLLWIDQLKNFTHNLMHRDN
jgi:geranylgeranyl diphosphate synthase type II